MPPRAVRQFSAELVKRESVYELTWLVPAGDQVDPEEFGHQLENLDPGWFVPEGSLRVLRSQSIGAQYVTTRVRFTRAGRLLEYVPERLEIEQHYGGNVPYTLGSVTALEEGSDPDNPGVLDSLGLGGAGREVQETAKSITDMLQDLLNAIGAGARGAGNAAEGIGTLTAWIPWLLLAVVVFAIAATRANAKVDVRGLDLGLGKLLK